MKQIIVMLLLLGIIVSGCIDSTMEKVINQMPGGKEALKQVPVMKVNITFIEKQGLFVTENYTITQGTVDYAARPQNTKVKSFPAISARVIVVRNNTNATMEGVGPWETLPFKGNGTYGFNIGFNEKYYPNPNDFVHISIIVSDEKGRRIGYAVHDKVWE